MPNPTIGQMVSHLRARAPKCGSTRVVLIDGPAGAGKSTLANRLAEALGGAASAGAGTFDPQNTLAADASVQILHGDDMYEGWDGLATLDDVLVGQVLRPLAHSEGQFRMWDWVENKRTHAIAVNPRPYLLIEGVGVASAQAREYAALVIWVEAPWEERLERGLARDGASYDVQRQWETFEAETQLVHSASGARVAADFVVDGTARY